MFSPAHLLLIFLVLLLPAIGSTVIPISEILHRSGHSRWWAPICFVPLVNCVALWVFAYIRWPALDRQSQQ